MMGVQQVGVRKWFHIRWCFVCLLVVVSVFSPVSRGACDEAKYPDTVKTAREFAIAALNAETTDDKGRKYIVKDAMIKKKT